MVKRYFWFKNTASFDFLGSKFSKKKRFLLSFKFYLPRSRQVMELWEVFYGKIGGNSFERSHPPKWIFSVKYACAYVRLCMGAYVRYPYGVERIRRHTEEWEGEGGMLIVLFASHTFTETHWEKWPKSKSDTVPHPSSLFCISSLWFFEGQKSCLDCIVLIYKSFFRAFGIKKAQSWGKPQQYEKRARSKFTNLCCGSRGLRSWAVQYFVRTPVPLRN